MSIYNDLFTFLYIVLVVIIGVCSYYIGRKSRLEDVEDISQMLTQGVVETVQPTKHHVKKVRWNPKNLLDPVEPEGEPFRKEGIN